MDAEGKTAIAKWEFQKRFFFRRRCVILTEIPLTLKTEAETTLGKFPEYVQGVIAHLSRGV